MPPGTVTSSATPSTTSTSLTWPFTTVPSSLDNLDSTDEVIHDTDLRVVYAGNWLQSLDDVGSPSRTSHSTVVKGSSLTVTFSGTGIDVLGFVHVGTEVIPTSFIVDGNQAGATSGSVSGTGIGITDQTFFSVRGLENKQHTLQVIVVGDGTLPRLFTIDCFVVTDANASASAGSGPTSSLPTSASASTSGSALTSGTASMTTTTALSGSNTSSPSSAARSSGQSISSSSSAGTAPFILDMSSTLWTSSPSGSAASSGSQLSASSGHHMSAGQVAGTVIGTLLGFALLVAFFLVFRKRRTPKLDTMPTPLFAGHSGNRVQGGFRNEKTYIDLEDLSPPEYEECNVSTSVHDDDYSRILYHQTGPTT